MSTCTPLLIHHLKHSRSPSSLPLLVLLEAGQAAVVIDYVSRVTNVELMRKDLLTGKVWDDYNKQILFLYGLNTVQSKQSVPPAIQVLRKAVTKIGYGKNLS